MKRTIAVETNLTPIKDLLTEKGYKVESISINADLSNDKAGQYDAFVVTGLDNNFMGINDTITKAVVVNADGLTAEQVYKELQTRLPSSL